MLSKAGPFVENRVGLVFLFTTGFFPEFAVVFFNFLPPASAALATDSVEGTLRGATGRHPSHFQGDTQIFGISSKGLQCVTTTAAPFPSVIRFYSSGALSEK